MSDTSPKDQGALLHGHRPATIPRTPRRGEEIWRLAKDGDTLVCELLDDSAVGAGWEVVLRRNDELIVGHRAGSRAAADHAVRVFVEDHQRTGWTAIAARD